MDEAVEKDRLGDKGELENEDFFLTLTEEERDCLQYLLETIDSLDVEYQEDNDTPDEDVRDHLSDSSDLHPKENLDNNRAELSESAKVAYKPEDKESLSKMKIIKSFSDDFPGCSITVSSEAGQRSTSSHPNHLRKFDTIMRSGVNVQELRARFIGQQEHLAADDLSKESELPGTSKQPPLIGRNSKSPRQEALQKLGLLKRKQSNSNAFGSSEALQSTNGETQQIVSEGANPSLEGRLGKTGDIDRCWPP